LNNKVLSLNDAYLRKLCFNNTIHISRLIELNKLKNTNEINHNLNRSYNTDSHLKFVKIELNLNDLQKLSVVNKYEYMYKKLHNQSQEITLF